METLEQPLEMSGESLHWKVLCKCIKEKCVSIGGIVLERQVIKHFVREGLSSRERRVQEEKVSIAIGGLISAGYVSRCFGIVEGAAGVCLVLLKYAGKGVEANE